MLEVVKVLVKVIFLSKLSLTIKELELPKGIVSVLIELILFFKELSVAIIKVLRALELLAILVFTVESLAIINELRAFEVIEILSFVYLITLFEVLSIL
jgi:hypothetical protein